MTIKPSKELTIELDTFRFLVIGPYGSGKSVFGSTLPQPGLVFDFTNNGKLYNKGDWDVAQYPLTPTGWMEFEMEWRKYYDLISSGKSRYKSVVFDDATGMENLAMERALQMDPKRNQAQGPLWNVHYQLVKNLCEGKYRQLLSLKVNVMVACHIAITKDEETGAVLDISPMLSGKLSTILPGYFDEVYYATTGLVDGKPAYRMQTIPVGLKQARSQASGIAGLLPNYVPNEFPKILAILEEALKKQAEVSAQQVTK